MSDAADHHHGGAAGADYLDLGESFPLLAGVLALQSPGPPAFTLVAKPQTVGFRLLDDPDERLACVETGGLLAQPHQVVVVVGAGLQGVTDPRLLVRLLHHLVSRGQLVQQAGARLHWVLLLGQLDELVNNPGQRDVAQGVRVHAEAERGYLYLGSGQGAQVWQTGNNKVLRNSKTSQNIIVQSHYSVREAHQHWNY